MNKRLFSLIVLVFTVCGVANAQRFTDNLGRGLVVSKTYNSNYLSWRRLTTEYYDVKYNVYRGNERIASNLTTTNYTDNNSSESNTYTVAAVINNVEQAKCTPQKMWGFTYLGSARYNSHLDISLSPVYDRDGNDVTGHYEPNDIEMADLDGDGQLEIIIKRLNTADAIGVNTGEKDGKGNDIYNIYPQDSKEFVVIDAYDIDWNDGTSTLLWRIDCGPNMVSSNSTEINIIAYDWDEDGKAEVVLRGADNMIVYGSDGRTQQYTIGDNTVNTRQVWPSTRKSDGTNLSSMAYTNTGAEYLIYINGQTGAYYQITDYPLKRLEDGETNLESAWGDGYGHRSSKYFFGAPFLDGRKASLFLGRGIYTRHKMIAMDLVSHQWTERWRWDCNDSNSPWYGNGYHNYIIADVDEDGRDEIVYGSMVIDDNGKGLSTTGYEHGDAQHVSDFDPYRKGLEFFGCLEDGPYYGSNYRNATTSDVYFKKTSTGDDGRALMGNFRGDIPGSQGKSASMGDWLNSLKDVTITGSEYMSVDNPNSNVDPAKWNQHINFRVYWDGDLCSEILDSGGSGGGEASLTKVGTEYGSRLRNLSGKTNNSTKNNACFVGDIIGDWREEVIMRVDESTIRVHTTTYSTDYSLPTLWNDHQYRQAMVWQMMAYNLPPHLSYFLGEMEGITVAPPPLTNRGRTEIANGGTIGTNHNGQHVLICDNNSTTSSFAIAEGAQPTVVTVNTPTWVQGTDVNGTSGTKVRTDGSIGVSNLPAINTTTYTHTLTGAALSGSTRLVKQGGGTLKLNGVTHTHTGQTDVWGGTLEFNGTLQNSPLWLNRFTKLISSNGNFGGGITTDYGSTIAPGGEGTTSTISTTTLTLNHGARLLLDVNSDGTTDKVNATMLVLNTKTGEAWEDYGPEYLKPVIEIARHGSLPAGNYDLGAVGSVTGDLSDIVLEGTSGLFNPRLEINNGHLWLVTDAIGVYTYFNDFETVNGATATAIGGNATIVGAGSFVNDANSSFGKVFQNVGGNTRTNYLKLPEDVLSYSAESNALTIGVWVKKSNATNYWYAPLFTAYGSGPNASNTWPMLACQTRGLLQVNCNGWCDFTAANNDNPSKNANNENINNESISWLEDGEWHYLTVVLTATTAKVCVDATNVLNSWTVDGVSDGQKISGLFSNGSELKYICLGGNQAWEWEDNDPGFAFDDIMITNRALTEDEIEEIIHSKPIIGNKGDLTSLINGNFESSADGWTGGIHRINQNWTTQSWRGDSQNAFYELVSSGTMSYTLHNMPAGTYKVVAAARSYDGGKLKAQVAGGSYGAELTGVGNSPVVGSMEINTNGVEMPYSNLGGFTPIGVGHNWRWITATGTLAQDGDLVINFVGTGNEWMAIDDVHLYCTTLNGTNYTRTVGDGKSGAPNLSKVTVTADIVMSNPNTIFRSTGEIITAAGEKMNNNQYSKSRITKLVLYDGYDFYDSGDTYGIDYGATLYRHIPANTWCTLMLPFWPTTELTMKYPSSLSNHVLTFSDVVKAEWNQDKPMLVKSSTELNSITGVRSSIGVGGVGVERANKTSGNDVPMVGTYTSIPSLTQGTYVVARKDNADWLFLVDGDNVSLAPFRAYFTFSAGGTAPARLALSFDDSPTAIDGVLLHEAATGNDRLYNLSGQRISRPTQGIYIRNGKKMLVK